MYFLQERAYRLLFSFAFSAKAQAKMAQYFVDIFGDHLLTEPLPTHPCEKNYPLPSPNDLKYKILIKNKKLSSNTMTNNSINLPKPGSISASSSSGRSTDATTTTQVISSDESFQQNLSIIEQMSAVESCLSENCRQGFVCDDDNSSDDEKPTNLHEVQPTMRESQATKAMSDLVHYIVPIHFQNFARAEERNHSFEISSFPEDRAYALVRDHGKEFLAYNQRQLSRVYPRGTRLESSNYNPYIFWPIGCQMIALNYQTLGKRKTTINFDGSLVEFRCTYATESRLFFL